MRRKITLIVILILFISAIVSGIIWSIAPQLFLQSTDESHDSMLPEVQRIKYHVLEGQIEHTYETDAQVISGMPEIYITEVRLDNISDSDFSLKKNIEALGHTCEFINIIPGRQLDGYKISRFHKLGLLCKRLWGWDFIKRFKTIYKFQTRFSKEFIPYLGVEPGENHKHYDVVVIGSDEVFNCAQQTWFGYSPQLFGKGLNADKIITYAASFGATTLEKLQASGSTTPIPLTRDMFEAAFKKIPPSISQELLDEYNNFR